MMFGCMTLRHSFASVGAAGGASLPIIGALLGHTQAQTTARYAHLADDPLQAAAADITGRIVAAMGDLAEAGEVRQFPKYINHIDQ
jgi:integrase